MAKRREIRNSTAEFPIFPIEGKEHGVEVMYADETIWCTQKAKGRLSTDDGVLSDAPERCNYHLVRNG